MPDTRTTTERPVLRARSERSPFPSWEETAHAAFRAGDPAELERLRKSASDTIRRRGEEAKFAAVHAYVARMMRGGEEQEQGEAA